MIANVFPKLKTGKLWLDHSPRSAVSKHPLAINMLKGLKHLWNVHGSTFIIFFFDHSDEKWLGKYLPYWTLKFEVGLLTHWLSMRSILFGIVRICTSLFKCNYVKNKKLFPKFLFRLQNLHEILNIFEKKMIANVFPKLQTVKDLVKPLSRKSRFRTSFDSQDVNGCQRLVKSAGEHFHYIFW